MCISFAKSEYLSDTKKSSIQTQKSIDYLVASLVCVSVLQNQALSMN